MVTSPYGFLRGTAIVMAADVAQLATGITPVVCGDAHLGNFGFYASPEGELVIDLNDFDEAHPGSWEWDLRRLVASIFVAGRENGASEEECHRCLPASPPTATRCASSPSSRCCCVASIGLTSGGCTKPRPRSRCAMRSNAQPSVRGPAPATEPCRGSPLSTRKRRIVEEPPLITRVSEEDAEAIARGSTPTC